MGAAATKKSMGLLLLLVVIIAVQTRGGKCQQPDCQRALGNLNVCAPSVVPGPAGDSPPPPECCSALQAVPHDCVCSTIRIASRLPARCNLPVINCAN